MRIFSAQLFKLYTTFLVAIATVALGASLVRREGSHGSLICAQQNALIKREDIPFEERCPEEYSLYIASLYDEICVDRTEFPETPHAFCIKEKCGLPFNNYKRRDGDACKVHSYSVSRPVNLVVAMMTYSTNMKPRQVVYHTITYNFDLTSANDVNNFTRVINGYNGEDIRYCFYGGTRDKVQARAAAWITD
ncbi:hypothetical protein RhiirA5_420379 [Rhizophagus irregularis]|uniref:Uncharacterized protein n=1 Tax=Rhizophagus irregularis TaxID=588596 RepID=A0A2I1F478_9GLOM|nr:hypothetical protein RhiirA5_420379 [Rhizophagus irregularis]PKC59193.1 hypothetical protein RhiirA1_469802 [Rhizophagus irregularis]PKY29183.1 hypothetical protein RhiirB3_445709 [Rhizophagus irregularis]CAB4481916.1 unnamed protein product [Rhizophagus irregularis]